MATVGVKGLNNTAPRAPQCQVERVTKVTLHCANSGSPNININY